ncbi:hypothetical protein HMPREF1586_00916 [Gardnerella vaginalis JCP8522]|nr:hypothetical protein HMPREF1586_00916 [Gardnerella vaginalis JCP8522]
MLQDAPECARVCLLFPHFVPHSTQITYKIRKNLPHFVPHLT